MTRNLLNYSTRFLMITILCFLSIGLAFAQAGTGGITGLVSDSTGAVIPSAPVKAVNTETGAELNTTASEDGFYKFTLLKPGKYAVSVKSGSFAEQKLEVEVQVGRTTDANFTLGASGVSATVEVTAEGVQTTSSNFDAVQSEQAIQNLPINGRRFQDFVTLTPSAQIDPSRGQISLSGQRGINGNVNVDGVDFNQPFFGGIRGGERSNQSFSLPQESIREFQVVAAGYNAEFGRSTGGIVNAVTKSGTNNLRGSAFYLLRPQKLARANSFANALADQRLNALGLEATLAPTQQQFGGSIGGPIVKDKLFYFGSYEQQRFRAPRQVLFANLIGVTPSTSQTDVFNFYRGQEVQYKQTNDAYAGVGKIDWNLTDSNRLSVRYNWSKNNALNGVATGETALDPTTNNSLSTNGTEKDQNNIVVGQFVSNLAPSVINEARFQFAKEKRPRISNANIANINTAIGVYGTRNFLPTTEVDKRTQVADSLTFITGNHTFKFGGEFSNIYANQAFGFNQFGVYTFAGLTSVSNSTVGGVANSDIGTPGLLQAIATQRYSYVASSTATVATLPYLGRFDTTTARYNQQVGNLQAAYTVKELSFFAQDAWRVSPNLTINYGLRWEKQYNPTAEANNSTVLNLIKNTAFPLLGGKGIDPANISDSPNQWGPRLGFAWDPKADGKTVIRGFAGEYYARTPLIGLAAPFNNFRDPAGDLSVTIGSTAAPTATTASNFDFAGFFAANPNYAAVTGLTAAQCATAGAASASTTLYNTCAPNTVYRQFAILGINLNSSSLSGLPTLTPAQLQLVGDKIRASTANAPASLGIYQNANFVGIVPNYRNPQSFQFGFGFEHEWFKDIVVGIDYSQVNTSHLQRNTDINLPSPTGVDATSGRVLVNRALRPLTNIGTIQLRDSSARSQYRGLTFRGNVNKKWGRINAFYTLSKSLSDDDNERDAGGVLYDNPYDLRTEYYLSRLDRRHQFVANPLFFLPHGFEVSSAIRIRAGSPINSAVGSDLNGDGNTNERPILVPGVELKRNYFYNKPLTDIDLRVQKGFSFAENRRIVFSAEFFNILNLSNTQFAGSATTNYCNNTLASCGLSGITNINFLNLIQQTTTATNFGKLNLAGTNPGSQVFQMQLGARFQF
jgi:Carboxypeptidase regulatory-like domain